jgi:4-aminobutyrate aminotransferase-like enzyme
VLTVGVKFADEHRQPDANAASQVLKYCLEHNLLLLNCGSYQNVIRWIPPLIVSEAEIDEAVGVFARALTQR